MRRARVAVIVTVALALQVAGPVSPALRSIAPVARAAPPTTVVISELMASVASEIPTGNTARYDWIELWNPGATAVDLTGWHLTDKVAQPLQFTLGPLVLGADERVVVFASEQTGLGPLHANFKLSAGGEYLGLTDPAGAVVHEFAPAFPAQAADGSYGLDPDGNATYLGAPTPGLPNVAAAPRAAAPVLSAAGGLYASPLSVAISTTAPGATIRYTLDGSTPSATNGALYSGPVAVTGTTVLRAAAIAPGLRDSTPTTASYLYPADVVAQGATAAGWPAGPVNGQVLDLGMDPAVVGAPGAEVGGSLASLPSISLVTDQANLTDPATGIYVNASGRGSAWERPVSVEILDPTGPDVQWDGGLRIRGGYSRRPDNPKHSLRLVFADPDDGLLQFDLFGSGTEAFDGLDLRTEQNHSWQEGSDRSTYLRETWSRDTWAAMGHATTRSAWFHLYLNGRYWGLYEVEEQVDARWAARELGGTVGAHAVVRSDNTTYGYEIDEGDDEAWLRLWEAIADQDVDDAEWGAISREVDLAALGDYALLLAYTGDLDATPSAFLGEQRANNWIAVGAPDAGIPWTFVPHDAEHSLGSVDHDVLVDRTGPFPAGSANPFWSAPYFNPGWLHQVLLERPEYRSIVSARVALATGPGGALTPDAATATWDGRLAEVQPGIAAESARWGDAARSPALGRVEWEAEVAWVRSEWFAARSPVVAAQVAARLAAAASPPDPTPGGTTTTVPATVPTTGPTTGPAPAPDPASPIVAAAAVVPLAPARRLGVVDDVASVGTVPA